MGKTSVKSGWLPFVSKETEKYFFSPTWEKGLLTYKSEVGEFNERTDQFLRKTIKEIKEQPQHSETRELVKKFPKEAAEFFEGDVHQFLYILQVKKDKLTNFNKDMKNNRSREVLVDMSNMEAFLKGLEKQGEVKKAFIKYLNWKKKK